MSIFLNRFNNFCSNVDKPPKPRFDELEGVLKENVVDRWAVYYFTLPVKDSKIVATGFESKSAAAAFIQRHLIKRDDNGLEIPKTVDIDGYRYIVKYDVIKDGKIDIFANDPDITVYGNNKNVVLEQWLG